MSWKLVISFDDEIASRKLASGCYSFHYKCHKDLMNAYKSLDIPGTSGDIQLPSYSSPEPVPSMLFYQSNLLQVPITTSTEMRNISEVSGLEIPSFSLGDLSLKETWPADFASALEALAQMVVASNTPISWTDLYAEFQRRLEPNKNACPLPQRKTALEEFTKMYCDELALFTKSSTRPPRFEFSRNFNLEIQKLHWSKLSYYSNEELISNFEDFFSRLHQVLRLRSPDLIVDSLTTGCRANAPRSDEQNFLRIDLEFQEAHVL
ncbi:hypothetical protein Ciccas_008495 [Cichlidogyrus casuarinus]|uniref:Uncharacterized protein n=1 Tax=Cichlidogyrus casuarinus TaxID=1844966 RepID=A0ABD2Q055_9PLAT